MDKRKEWNWDFILMILLSTIFFVVGFYLIKHNKVLAGIDGRTQLFSAKGGEVYFLIGLIFLFVSYFTLNPFGRIRTFVERLFKPNRKK